MQSVKRISWILFLVLASACHDDDGAVGGSGKRLGNGSIYFEWSNDGLQKMDLGNARKSVVLPDDVNRNAFDISWDGEMLLICTDNPDDYDSEIYALTNLSSGTIVHKFIKYSGYANLTSPILSPDNTLIAVPSTFDNGILIMDMEGNILHELVGIGEKEFDHHIVWMPDNTLLLSAGANLYRTDDTFTHATLIKTFDFDVWGAFATSRDGGRIALRGGNHIWLMNADGSNLAQVTESSNFESWPIFSPDGKFLLVGSDPTLSYGGYYFYHMRILPADGKLYDVDEGADPNVIPVISSDEYSAEAYYPPGAWR